MIFLPSALGIVAPAAGVAGSSTWNPADRSGGISLSAGNTIASGESNVGVRGTLSHSSGVKQFEVNVTARGGSDSLYIGFGNASALLQGPGTTGANSAGYRASGAFWYNSSDIAYSSTWTTADVIGVLIDKDSSTFSFYKNGSLIHGPLSFGTYPVSGALFPMVGSGGSGTGWSLELVTSGLAFPVGGADEWG